jgi:uncharacterized protein YdaL
MLLSYLIIVDRNQPAGKDLQKRNLTTFHRVIVLVQPETPLSAVSVLQTWLNSANGPQAELAKKRGKCGQI